MARAFTKQFIWITGILNIVFGLATGIYYLYKKQYAGGIVFVLFAVFSIVCFVSFLAAIFVEVLILILSSTD